MRVMCLCVLHELPCGNIPVSAVLQGSRDPLAARCRVEATERFMKPRSSRMKPDEEPVAIASWSLQPDTAGRRPGPLLFALNIDRSYSGLLSFSFRRSSSM